MRSWQSTDRSLLSDAAHVFVLSGFAVAQPLYDLLGRNTEFFIAHRAGAAEIVALALGLSLGCPAILVALELLAYRLGRSVQSAIHALLVAGMAAAVAAPVLARVTAVPASVSMGGALALGAALAWIYCRSSVARRFVSLLAPSIVVFPVLFVAFTPVSSLILPGPAGAVEARAGTIQNPVPIVLVVFDEFEAGALLDERREADPVRFPHLATLAKDSWWFPHAVTAWPETKRAVPAILTGLEPRNRDAVPTVRSHPNNLFTWLGGQYRFNVMEPWTSLCPERFCRSAGKPVGSGSRAKALLSDLAIVYLHILLPPSVATQLLPPMDTGWGGFGSDHRHDHETAAYADRSAQFASFVDGVKAGPPGALHFLHILLPHIGYTYLPSGTTYLGEGTEGLEGEKVWTDDDLLPSLAYHRYLLQVGYVDKLVGRLMQRLKAEGLYDASLVIITADHGKSFRPGQPARLLTKENAPDLLHVPLFVKLPGQTEGRRSEKPVSTLDILPTIAEILKTDLPWRTDGVSLFAAGRAGRDSIDLRPLDSHRSSGRFKVSELTSYPRLSWKLQTFGSRTPLGSLVPSGRYPELVGRDLSTVTISESGDNVSFRSDQLGAFDDIQPASGILPAHFRGELLDSAAPLEQPQDLAIAMNGVIRAVTRTTRWLDRPRYFSLMLPENAFRPGRNRVEVFRIRRIAGDLSLSRVPALVQEEFRLVRDDAGQEVLVSGVGERFEIRAGAVQGHLDAVNATSGSYALAGWALAAPKMNPVSRVVLFADGRQVYSGKPSTSRPDLVRLFRKQSALNSGFSFALPRGFLDGKVSLRIFGISDTGFASELTIAVRVRTVLQD